MIAQHRLPAPPPDRYAPKRAKKPETKKNEINCYHSLSRSLRSPTRWPYFLYLRVGSLLTTRRPCNCIEVSGAAVYRSELYILGQNSHKSTNGRRRRRRRHARDIPLREWPLCWLSSAERLHHLCVLFGCRTLSLARVWAWAWALDGDDHDERARKIIISRLIGSSAQPINRKQPAHFRINRCPLKARRLRSFSSFRERTMKRRHQPATCMQLATGCCKTRSANTTTIWSRASS